MLIQTMKTQFYKNVKTKVNKIINKIKIKLILNLSTNQDDFYLELRINECLKVINQLLGVLTLILTSGILSFII